MKKIIAYYIICILLCAACSKDKPERDEFIDPVFIEYLHTKHRVPLTEDHRIDLDDDMTQLRLGAIVDLQLYGLNIRDLTGIRNLINLNSLYMQELIRLKSLDINGLKHITRLDCIKSAITQLNIQNTPNLEILDCTDNDLTSIDLSNHPNLSALYCSNNKLTAINIMFLPQLKTLSCHSNQLSALDVSNIKPIYDYDFLVLECGKQTDEKGKDLRILLILSEQMREKWNELKESDYNENVEAHFLEKR